MASVARGGAAPPLFRVAAGTRLGFGHLVRAVALARALGVVPRVALRGGKGARVTALALGCRLVSGRLADLMAGPPPEALVVDDPSARSTSRWRRAARRAGVPIVSVHDLGIGRGDADLEVDGSPGRRRATSTARATTLRGPRYAVLDPAAARERPAAAGGRRAGPVLIALGGGRRRWLASRLANALAAADPALRIRVADGFAQPLAPRRVPTNVTWLEPSRGLARELAGASVAVVGGGITLYECCHFGIPAIAIAVVPAQRPTIRAFAARGAVRDGGLVGRSRGDRIDRLVAEVVGQVTGLLGDWRGRRRLGARARAQVDGRGAHRVASAIRALAKPRPTEGRGR